MILQSKDDSFLEDSDEEEKSIEEPTDFQKFQHLLLDKDYQNLLDFTDLERQVDTVLIQLRKSKRSSSDRDLLKRINQEVIHRRLSKGSSILSARYHLIKLIDFVTPKT